MQHQVFEGVKVADFSWIAAGPWTTKYLADHGATVIKMESESRPDMLRACPPYKGDVPGMNRTSYFTMYNNNKYSMHLNLNLPRGIEVAKRVVAWADVVAESFGPGRMKLWGLDYEELKKVKPSIIMYSTTQQGQTGPGASQPGFGTQLTSLAGFTYLTGWPDREPSLPYGAYTDTIAPRLATAALIAALDYRRRTGKGQYIELSQFEAAVHFISPVILDYQVNGNIAQRKGNLSSIAVPHGAYPCRGDDRWCVIAAYTEQEWQCLCTTMGNPIWTRDLKFATLIDRKKNEEELNVLISEWTMLYNAEEVMIRLQEAGVPAGVVETAEDIYSDPQLQHRHHFWKLVHPEMGEHSYNSPSFRLSKTPCQLDRPAPCLGQHTEYICTQVLGMTDEEFVELLTEGVLQ
ncbi:MAG: CoA transferase [Chloroflexota bacterium]|nr:CoA transferase [Chloroflexota bacterium]